jgi:hypothetical protein
MVAKLNTNRKPVLRRLEGKQIRYICPKCKEVLHIKSKYKQNLCMRCGQYLDWEPIANDWYTVYIICQNQDEAGYYTGAYYKHSGNEELLAPGIFSDRTKVINREWPKELMFIFLEKKGYGRFMRWLAKEGSG